MLEVAIGRPVTVIVGVILVSLFGYLALTQLPIQLTPDIAVPTLSVRTGWPGAAPSEVESQIIEEQEEALKSLSGLERMESSSSLASGRLTLELTVGTPIQESLVRATNLLSQVPAYPEAASEPVLTTSNSTGPPLAVITLTADDRRNPEAFRTWALDSIQPSLERIPGVSEAWLRGGRDRELRVEFDPHALASRGITIRELSEAVRRELTDLSGGDFTLGKRSLLVRTPLEPEVPEDLGALVLANQVDGGPILLRDVAHVAYGLREPDAMVLSDDRPSMVFLLFREAGSNVLETTLAIREEVERMQAELLAPRGLRLEVVSDQVEYIQGALDLVQQNLLAGGVLAIVVLLIFLGSLRASAVVSIAIPVCTLGTALGMALLGRTINVVSLAGMAFAVGMVVDNAIVVLENIDSHRARTGDIKLAAARGTREVWGAVLASTLTTVVVFLPIIRWQDEVGEILRDVAVAISLAVSFSLVVSVLVIPSLAAAFVPSKKSSVTPQRVVRAATDLRRRLAESVGWIIRSPARAFSITLLVITLTGASIWALLPPLEYLPTGNRAFVFGILVPPPGIAIEEIERVGRDLQAQVLPQVRARPDRVLPRGGPEAEPDVPRLERWFFTGGGGRIFSGAGLRQGDDVGAVLDWYRGLLSQVPGMFGIATQASLFGRSIGGSRSIEMEIQGGELETLVDVGARLLGRVRSVLPEAQVRPIPSLDLGAPEVQVRPRREAAARLGMSGSDIGLAVDAMVDGAIIGEVGPRGDRKVDVVVAAEGRGVTTSEELRTAPVATPLGRVVPLDAIAYVDTGIGPTELRRVERRRTIALAVSPPENLALEEAIRLLREDVVGAALDAGEIPYGVEVRFEGTAGDLERAKTRLGTVLLLAVLISYLLMAALFEDFIAPLVIMACLPFAGSGGILGLLAVDRWLGNQPLDLLTAVGFVILVGVVVNNAILVVDGALLRLREGAGLTDAVVGAVESRIRPIFMSTLTSLAGLSPLVLFPGSGSELYRGVGSIVLGGLALSTVLTLFVIPALFSLVWRLRGARG